MKNEIKTQKGRIFLIMSMTWFKIKFIKWNAINFFGFFFKQFSKRKVWYKYIYINQLSSGKNASLIDTITLLRYQLLK